MAPIDLALRHARQIAPLLIFGAIGEDVGRHDIRMKREARPRRADARKLLHHDCGMKPVAPASAILFGDRRQEQPRLACGMPDRLRHDRLFFPLRMMRRDFAFDKFANLLAIKLVLMRK